MRVALGVLGAMVLLGFVASPASAAKSGSKTEAGTAAYLLVFDTSAACNSKDGVDVSPEVLSTSTVPYGKYSQAWVKSTARLDEVTWRSYVKGRLLNSGTASPTGASCGNFLRVDFAHPVNGETDSGPFFYGSITVKFFSTTDGVTKAIGNDSITFEAAP